jgi:hypothetical protein
MTGVPIQRRRRGFEHAGALPLDRLGLPRTRAREMVLARAWERVAGPVLAARARAVRVQRGVLEIEVACGRWSETLCELLPRLAGRLSRVCPELGVRKFKLIRSDSNEQEVPRPIEITSEPVGSEEPQGTRAARGTTTEVEDRRPQDVRLEDLARRYLERDRNQNQ